MNSYDIVFVVLTYKVSKDLKPFLESVEELNIKGKVIIVNAFYSDKMDNEIKAIADQYDADYISVPNKGYSFGNNTGIRYALLNYDFSYIMICNPDIVVKKMDLSHLKKERVIYGPNIVDLAGDKQNPFRVRYSPIGEWMNYAACKYDHFFLMRMYSAFNKVERVIFNISLRYRKNRDHRIYAVHGCSTLISYDVVRDMMPIYNEKMFLFAEEDYLAFTMRKKQIPVYYTEDIQILHKEDGTIRETNINTLETIKKSYMIYYEGKKMVN